MAQRKYVQRLGLEEYREKYADFLVLEREDGILTARMHTDGESAKFGPHWHNALPQAWYDIGNDLENEVVIITGTGDRWLGAFDPSMNEPPYDAPLWAWDADSIYSRTYFDATHLLENLLWNIDVPTIAAVNGPGFHTEFAFLCDLTLAAEGTEFFDPHTSMGLVAGDGQHLVFQELIGLKRAAFMVYSGQSLSAEQALEWGLVNEVLPPERLLDRSTELAYQILKLPRIARRMQSQVLRRPWKRRMMDDMQVGLGHELLAMMLDKPGYERFRAAVEDAANESDRQ